MSKNQDIDLDDDNFDFDQGFGDDDFNFNFDDLDPDNDRNASTFSKARRWTKEALKDELKSPERQVRFIKNTLPKSYNTSIDAAQGVYGAGVSLYNDARDEFDKTAPAIKRKLKSQAGLLRKIRLNKLADWVEQEEESNVYQPTDYEEEEIRNQLNEVFSSAITQGLIKAKQAEDEASAEEREEELAQEQLNRKREEGFQRQSIAQGQLQGNYLRSMARDLRKQSDYQDQVTANVQRKSLEVQLRSFVLQQAFNQRFVQHSIETVGELKAITKNTALPDYAKINSHELVLEAAQRDLYSKIGGFFDGNLRQLAARVQTKLSNKIRETGGSISRSLEQGSQVTDTGLPVGQLITMLGTSALMDEGQRLIEPHLRKQLNKIPGLDAMGQSSDAILKNLGRIISENRPGGTGYRHLDKVVDFFELNRNQHQSTFTLKDSEQRELDRAAILDNRFKRSVTEVLPEWLSRIHNELRIMRTGNEGSEADRWDWQSGRITSADELRSRTERKLKSANNRAARNYNAAVDNFMRHLDPDDVFTKEQHEFVRKWYFERIKNNRSTIILEIFKEKIPESVNASDLKDKIKVNTGLTDADFNAYGSGSLKNYINMARGASRKTNNWLATEAKHREDAARYMPMDLVAIQQSIKEGYGREAIELGYARINPETGAIELDPTLLQRAAMSQGRVEYKQSGSIYKDAKNITRVKRGDRGERGWEDARYFLGDQQREEQLRTQKATEAAYRQYHRRNATHNLFTDADEYLEAAERQRRQENDSIYNEGVPGVPRFAGGGYTGRGDPAKPAGVVDHEEFVVSNKATKENRAVLEAVNKLGAPLFNKDGSVNKVYHKITGHDKFKKAKSKSTSLLEHLSKFGIDSDHLTDDELDTLTNPKLSESQRIRAALNARMRIATEKATRAKDTVVNSDLAKGVKANSVKLSKQMKRTAKSGVKKAGEVYDIFIQQSKDAVLTAEGFLKGWYYDENTGKVLTSPAQITGNVVNESGDLIVGAGDLLKGTWDKLGNKIKLPSLNLEIMKGRSLSEVSNEIKSRIANSKAVRKGRIFKNATLNALLTDVAVDVYAYGRDTPVLTADGFINGQYLDAVSGDVLSTHHDIRGIVTDLQGRIILDLKQLHDGLYDETGRPLKISQLKQIRNLMMVRGKALYKKHVAPKLRNLGDRILQGHERRLMGAKPIDVWKQGESKPRLYATGFEAGVVTDTDTGEVLKSHLMIKGGVSVAGTPILSLEEVLDGLYDEEGNKLELPRMKSLSARLVDHAGRAVMGTKTYRKFRKWLSGEKTDKSKHPFDVYIHGEITPILLKTKFEAGEYFCKGEDGPIYLPAQITGAVYDSEGNLLVAEDQLTDLVDVTGQPVAIGMSRNVDKWRAKAAGNNIFLKGLNRLKAKRREAMTDLFDRDTGVLKLKGIELNQGKLFRADNRKPIENYGDIAAGVVDALGQSIITSEELATITLCDSAGKNIITKGSVSGKGGFARKLKSMFGLREGSWQWKRKKKEEAERNKSKDVNIKIDQAKEPKEGFLSKLLGGMSGIIGTLATTMFSKFGGWFGKLRNAILLQKLAGGLTGLGSVGKGKLGLALKVGGAALTAYAGYKAVNSLSNGYLGDFFGNAFSKDEMDAIPLPGMSRNESGGIDLNTGTTGSKAGDYVLGGMGGEVAAMAAMGGTVYGVNKWREKNGKAKLGEDGPAPTTRKGKVIHALTKNPYGRVGLAGALGLGGYYGMNQLGMLDASEKGIGEITAGSALASYGTDAALIFGLPWLKGKYDQYKARKAASVGDLARADRFRKLAEAANAASTVSDIADLGSKARNRLGGSIAKRGLIRRGASTLGSGAAKIGKAVASINPMAIAKGAFNVGRFLIGPAGLAIGAVALVGYLGYKFYKNKKAKQIPFTHLRMSQYGFEMGSKESEVLLKLESLLAQHTAWSDKNPSIKESIPTEQVLELFGITDPQSEEAKEHLPRLLIWFQHRFKPIYLSYVKQASKLGYKDFTKLETNVGAMDMLRIVKDVHFTNTGGQNPYLQSSSPFKTPDKVTEDIDKVQKKVKWAMNAISSNENKNPDRLTLKDDEGLGDVDKPNLDEKIKAVTDPDAKATTGSGLSSNLAPSGKSISAIDESVKGMRDMGKISKALSEETNKEILKTQEEANKNMESLWTRTWTRVKELASKAVNFANEGSSSIVEGASSFATKVGANLSAGWDAVTGGSKHKNVEANLIQACLSNGITDPKEIAMFLAQCAHESGNFKYSEEIASGKAYEGRKDLGNTQPGDGKRFKGRGYLQVTGRANYTAFAKRSGIDVLSNPDIIAKDPKVAAMASVDWWLNNSRARRAGQAGDILAASKAVNGGTNGLDDRKKKWAHYSKVIGSDPQAYLSKLGGGSDSSTKAAGNNTVPSPIVNGSTAPSAVKQQASSIMTNATNNVSKGTTTGGIPPTLARPTSTGGAVTKTDVSAIQSATTPKDKLYFVGDSIAHGYKEANGGEGWTKEGISPKTVLMYLTNSILKTPSLYRTRKVYLSTGFMNDTSATADVAEQLRRLKVAGVKVNVFGISNQYPSGNPVRLNAILANLCKTYGHTFLGGFESGKDKIHPANYKSLTGSPSSKAPVVKSTTKTDTVKVTPSAKTPVISNTPTTAPTSTDVKGSATEVSKSPQGNTSLNAKSFAQSMEPGLVQLGKDNTSIADNGVDLKGMNQDFMTIFYAMVGEWKKSGGQGRVLVNSAYRSVEKQRVMYEAYLKRNRAAPAVARPGNSRHNSGVAIDINSNFANQMNDMGLLKKYKFHRPVRNEAWHLENLLFSIGKDTQRGIDQDKASGSSTTSSSTVSQATTVTGSSGGLSSSGAATQQEYGASNVGMQDAQVITTLTQQLAVQKEILKELKEIKSNFSGKSKTEDKTVKNNVVPETESNVTQDVNKMLGNVLTGIINRIPGNNQSGQPLSQQFPVGVKK